MLDAKFVTHGTRKNSGIILDRGTIQLLAIILPHSANKVVLNFQFDFVDV